MEREVRTVQCSFETREKSAGDSGEKTHVVAGFAARFDENSEPIMGMFYERIAPGAFDSALRKSDPRVLFNHNENYILGRKSAGTLRLKALAEGLHYEADLPDTQYARDLWQSMQRGDVKESSFAFTVDEEEWIDPENSRGLPTRVIKRVGQLYDVSPVTYPAYPTTTSEARGAQEVFSRYKPKEPEKPDYTNYERQLKLLES